MNKRYKVVRQLFGNLVDASDVIYDSEAAALGRAVNLATEFAQQEWPKAHAKMVGVHVCASRGGDTGVWNILAGHDNKVGAFQWFVVEV